MAARLKTRLAPRTQEWLAATIHKDQTTISLYLSGKRRPTPETMVALCRALDVSADWLLGLERPNSPDPLCVREAMAEYVCSVDRVEEEFVVINGVRYVPIPHLRDPIAAGSGIISSGAVDDIHLIAATFARRLIRKGPMRPGRLVMVDIDDSFVGVSMEPTIRRGATLIADLGAEPGRLSSFRDGAIYLVRTPDGVTCKRVWKTGDSLNLHCDNKTKAPTVLPLAHGEQPMAHLIGRVVCIANPPE